VKGRRIVLSLCDKSGIMVRPWVEEGFDCWIVDSALTSRGFGADGIMRVAANVLTWAPPFPLSRVAIGFAFPPCTDLAGSGARWWEGKGAPVYHEATHLAFRCRDLLTAAGAPWMLENPVGRLTRAWRKPDWTFHPWEYGGYFDPPVDGYPKRTCIWCGAGFQQPPQKETEITDPNFIHYLSGKDRPELGSITPRGFAQAVFETMLPAVKEARK